MPCSLNPSKPLASSYWALFWWFPPESNSFCLKMFFDLDFFLFRLIKTFGSQRISWVPFFIDHWGDPIWSWFLYGGHWDRKRSYDCLWSALKFNRFKAKKKSSLRAWSIFPGPGALVVGFPSTIDSILILIISIYRP